MELSFRFALIIAKDESDIDIMEQANILALAERCRRLARETSDGQMRNSLEALAQDYESQLPAGGNPGAQADCESDEDGDGGARAFTPRTRH